MIGTPTFQTIPTVLFDYLGYHFVRTNAAVVSIILMVPSVALLFIAERLSEDGISVLRLRQALSMVGADERRRCVNEGGGKS